jgi:hypothetical protein
MKKNCGGNERPKKKGEPRVQYYDDKKGHTNVNIVRNNNGNVVIQNGSNSEGNHRATLEMLGEVFLLEAERSALIRTYVSNTLLKKKKFIATLQGGELDNKHHICTRILFDLKIGSKKDQKHFSVRNRGHVRKCLGIKRNNLVRTLKQNFMSKWIFLEMNSNITSTKFVSCIDMCDRMDHQATRE